MVLEIKGYDPTEVGLRKFLTQPEAEVLECLWEIGEKGECCKNIRERLEGKGCSHSLVTVDKTLRNLEARGIVASQTVTRSPTQLVYYPTASREKAQAMLVEHIIANLKTVMPEALAQAAKKLKP